MTGLSTGALVIGAPDAARVEVVPFTTRRAAERHTDRIRATVVQLGELVLVAWERKAHEAMGYGTGAAGWDAYCQAELWPALEGVSLSLPVRREAVEVMRTRGMSQRAIARGLKVSPATINADLELIGDPAPPTTTALDGRQRSASTRGEVAGRPQSVDSPVDAGPMTATDWALLLVRGQGARGLTARELCLETGWHHGQASGALSRLHKRRQVTPSEQRRDGYGAYVATPDTP